jgi:hypothetical protein
MKSFCQTTSIGVAWTSASSCLDAGTALAMTTATVGLSVGINFLRYVIDLAQVTAQLTFYGEACKLEACSSRTSFDSGYHGFKQIEDLYELLFPIDE